MFIAGSAQLQLRIIAEVNEDGATGVARTQP
jgi:hypothetical protein